MIRRSVISRPDEPWEYIHLTSGKVIRNIDTSAGAMGLYPDDIISFQEGSPIRRFAKNGIIRILGMIPTPDEYSKFSLCGEVLVIYPQQITVSPGGSLIYLFKSYIVYSGYAPTGLKYRIKILSRNCDNISRYKQVSASEVS